MVITKLKMKMLSKISLYMLMEMVSIVRGVSQKQNLISVLD